MLIGIPLRFLLVDKALIGIAARRLGMDLGIRTTEARIKAHK
jgi:hypothetical protein